MGYERRGSEVWWMPDGMKLEGGFELPEAQIGPFESLPKRINRADHKDTTEPHE